MFFCAFSSPAAYGHSQRLSDGDQWSSEQSRQWLGHHQFRGEPHYKLIGCSFIFSDFILVLFLARLWRWIMLLLYSHMLTILTSVTTDPWDNCQSVYCALWQIKKKEKLDISYMHFNLLYVLVCCSQLVFIKIYIWGGWGLKKSRWCRSLKSSCSRYDTITRGGNIPKYTIIFYILSCWILQ